MYSSYYMSIIGLIRVDASDRGITKIELDNNLKEIVENDYSKLGVKELEEYFMDHRTFFDLPLDLDETPFYNLVRKSIMDIPYGKTVDYEDIIGKLNISDSKVIKTFLINNPLPIVIPTHRIINSKEKCEYILGNDIQKLLLLFEGCDKINEEDYNE